MVLMTATGRRIPRTCPDIRLLRSDGRTFRTRRSRRSADDRRCVFVSLVGPTH